MIEKKDYQDALHAQSACNLSGIVHSFSETLTRIWEEANENGKGTDWVNKHPICILFAEQISHLAKGDYFDAYKVCKERGKS
jgi:hypothetical protein